MWSDPNWVNYTQESAKLGALESQENKLLKPVDFYDLKIWLDTYAGFADLSKNSSLRDK